MRQKLPQEQDVTNGPKVRKALGKAVLYIFPSDTFLRSLRFPSYSVAELPLLVKPTGIAMTGLWNDLFAFETFGYIVFNQISVTMLRSKVFKLQRSALLFGDPRRSDLNCYS